MRARRTALAVLAVWVAALFVAGVVWRALHPERRERQPTPAATLAARQDGYYLCLHRAKMTDAQMQALIARRLPDDVPSAALRGCREAQQR